MSWLTLMLVLGLSAGACSDNKGKPMTAAEDVPRVGFATGDLGVSVPDSRLGAEDGAVDPTANDATTEDSSESDDSTVGPVNDAAGALDGGSAGETTSTQQDSGSSGVTDLGGASEDTAGGGGGQDSSSGQPCSQESDCPASAPICTPQGTCQLCYAGVPACFDDMAYVCDTDGLSYSLVEDCPAEGKWCAEGLGLCISPCGQSGKLAFTNAGCEFWAVDLHNAVSSTAAAYLDAQNAPFAVVVANPNEQGDAQVTLTMPDGLQQQTTLAPSALHAFVLPPSFGLEGSGITQSAFRLESTARIVAYQFNPLDDVDVFSNDASVLLPVANLGTDYRAISWQHQNLGGDHNFPATLTVVAVEDGTSVTIDPTCSFTGGDGVGAIGAGMNTTLTLNAGQVLNLETSGNGSELTGTRIQSSAPVAVFGGHVAARTSSGGTSDHLEEQLPPVSRWGKEIVLARSIRRDREKEHFRVLAAEDGTSITRTVGGSVSVLPTLNAGQFHEFTVDDHVIIESNTPVLVAQFLASNSEVRVEGPCNPANVLQDCGQAYVCDYFAPSSAVTVCLAKSCPLGVEGVCGPGYTCREQLNNPTEGPTCYALGDPSMILGVPVEQWRADHVFLTPDKYAEDYVSIIARSSAAVTLDSQAIGAGSWEALAGSDFKVARLPLSDGVHVINASEPVGITVYGWDGAVSYGYPGSMGLSGL